jgi:uncharacterized damage-inducible protein DinB
MTQPPYLRGEVEGKPLMVSVWLRGLEDVEETVVKWSEGLNAEGFWWTPGDGLNSIGGLIRHIGGASERLTRYAQGRPIPEELRRSAAQELSATAEAPEVILSAFYGSFSSVRAALSDLPPEALQAVHPVGRAAVPTKAAFILHHLVEHAQHHAGQVIVTRKLWKLNGRRT